MIPVFDLLKQILTNLSIPNFVRKTALTIFKCYYFPPLFTDFNHKLQTFNILFNTRDLSVSKANSVQCVRQL